MEKFGPELSKMCFCQLCGWQGFESALNMVFKDSYLILSEKVCPVCGSEKIFYGLGCEGVIKS